MLTSTYKCAFDCYQQRKTSWIMTLYVINTGNWRRLDKLRQWLFKLRCISIPHLAKCKKKPFRAKQKFVLTTIQHVFLGSIACIVSESKKIGLVFSNQLFDFK